MGKRSRRKKRQQKQDQTQQTTPVDTVVKHNYWYEVQYKDQQAKSWSTYFTGTDLPDCTSMRDKLRRMGYPQARVLRADLIKKVAV